MNLLFVHQNFPGQYRHLAAALVQRGHNVRAIHGPSARAALQGVELHGYDPMPSGGIPPCHPLVADFQTKVLRAEAVARQLDLLATSGYAPDLIIGHPGWGELLLVKDLFPDVPVLHQVEFVYQLQGGDTDFDPEFRDTGWLRHSRLRLRRATQLLAFHDLTWGLAPTQWQASTAPPEFRDRVSVIHEGIDTTQIAPRPDAQIQLRNAGLTLRPGDEVVSYVARNLEPYRGFHCFMRMLPRLQELRPNAQVVILGGQGVSYGAPPKGGAATWKEQMLQELEGQLDLSRIHFVGPVPHPVLHDLFRVSACHVYLTYPFVLSWSLLEAMACEALIVGSATPPLQEVIDHGVNGLLVDFFDGEALAQTIARVLEAPQEHRLLRQNARRTVVDRFDLNSVCLPAQLELVETLLRGHLPSGGR